MASTSTDRRREGSPLPYAGMASRTALLSIVATPLLAVCIVIAVSWMIAPDITSIESSEDQKAQLELRWEETNLGNSNPPPVLIDGDIAGSGSGYLFVRIKRDDLAWEEIRAELGWPPKLPGKGGYPGVGLLSGGLTTYSMRLMKIGESAHSTEVDRVFLGGSGTHALVRIPLEEGLRDFAAKCPEISLDSWIINAAMSPEGLQSIPEGDAFGG